MMAALLLLMSFSPAFSEGNTPLFSASVIDLRCRPLVESPNAVVPRYGLMKGITEVKEPVLELRRTTVSPSRGTILLFPGGGYHALAFEHEGDLVARFLNSRGYDVAILEYSIGEGSDVRARALADAKAAVRLLADSSAKLGLNPKLSVMGFSAGGHLAARLLHELGPKAPLSRIILIYPAYLEDSPEGKGIHAGVTPPAGFAGKAFVLIGGQDHPEWVGSAGAYAEAFRKDCGPAEFHLLPGTGHGFGMKPGLTGPAATWPDHLGEFLGH